MAGLLSAALVAAPALAAAEPIAGEPAAPAAPLDPGAFPGAIWFFDGGALPFVYGSATIYGIFGFGVEPRDTPLWFSPDEGGLDVPDAQIPSWLLALDSTAVGAGILVIGDDSRWFHLKGFVEGTVTTLALTQVVKDAFGRHRPSFQVDGNADEADARSSFFSGHSSQTLAGATYFALYLRYHGFDRWRPHGTFAWWEALPYAGLATVAFAIPYGQVRLHRHYVSDVVAGSAAGAGVAAMFYWYQERRYRAAVSAAAAEPPPSVALVPWLDGGGAALVGTF